VNPELVILLPPPQGGERPSPTALDAFCERYGPIPDDHRAFVETYGPGSIDGELVVAVPNEAGTSALIDEILEHERLAWQYFPDEHPFPPFPSEGSLLPWGADGNGTYFYWLVEGEAENWTVVVIGFDGGPIVKSGVGMTAFLAQLLAGAEDRLPFVRLSKDEHWFDSTH
jgi:hypothetical protein